MPNPAIRSRKRTSSATFNANPVATSGSLHDNLRMHVEYRAPAELKPPKRILRKHSPRQIEQIKASITAHGFLNPILVDAEQRIVCGHGRWLAATALGMTGVPVIEAAHLNAEQLRLYAIADNRIAEQSEFDMEQLKLEFVELDAALTDLNLELKLELSGFTTSEIDDLLQGKEPNEESEGSGSETEGPAITRLGDLWLLGDHRLLCGNSLEAESYGVLLDGEKAGMIFADPPYNIPTASISGNGKIKHRDFEMASGEMSRAEFIEFLATVFRLLAVNSADGSIHFQCMDWKHAGEMLTAGEREYAELKNLIVFAKQSAGMGTFYRSQHELIFAWKNGKAPHVNNFGLGETGRHRSNLWQYKGNSGFHRNRQDELAAHPTVKPWSLVADAIRDCSEREAIILDPFGGYGTTLIAAERTRRKGRLIEIDPLYCDATIRRWQELTGKTATLAASGQSFAEVALKRGVAQDAEAEEWADEGEDAAQGGDDEELG